MTNSPLTALSPLDGRYGESLQGLRETFSEFALMRQRLRVELAWWKTMLLLPALYPAVPSRESLQRLDEILTNFSLEHCREIKGIERETRHDVKALEYWLQRQVEGNSELAAATPLIHFACTSEDINNLAYALMLQEAREKILLPELLGLIRGLRDLAHGTAQLPMLARTHGQSATPTTLGKEMAIFVSRLERGMLRLDRVQLPGKFNGAVGNYNAHVLAVPEVDWPHLNRAFVESLGLAWSPYTTQIEPHDGMAEYLDALAHVNIVLLDLSRDCWFYVSLEYFQQQARQGEVGSSTMPHKVNPIDFENAEGNLGLANGLLRHMADKLPISRLQRDLSDSTVQRNLGVAVGHSLVAWQSLGRGLGRVRANPQRMVEDLENAYSVLAEGVQTLLRRYGCRDSYERLKDLTRGKPLTRENYLALVEGLPLPEGERKKLAALTPGRYLGLASELAEKI